MSEHTMTATQPSRARPTSARRSTLRTLLARFALCVGFIASAPLLAQDLAMMELVSPQSGCMLSATENVTVRMFNHGPTVTQGTTVMFQYIVDSSVGSNAQLVLDAAWEANSSKLFTFPTPANLSQAGGHTITVSLNLAADTHTGNNTLHNIAVTNAATTVPGTLAAAAPGPSGTLTLSNHVGAVLQWEESPDGERWYRLANTGNTQSYVGLTVPRKYRVRVANAPCAPAVSNVVTTVP
jgi:hypothetical protein